MTARSAISDGMAADSDAPGLTAFRERRWVPLVLALADIVTLEICLYAAFLLRDAMSGWFPILLGAPAFIGLFVGVLVVPLTFWMMGLYPGYGIGGLERFSRRTSAVALVFATLIAWDYLVQGGEWSRGVLLATWLLASFALPVSSTLARDFLMRRNCWGTPVVIAGANDRSRAVIRSLQRTPAMGFVPVCVLDDDRRLTGTALHGVPVIGPVSRAGEVAQRVRTVILALPAAGEDAGLSAPNELNDKLPFPHVVLVPELFGIEVAWVSSRDLGGILGLEMKKNLLLRHNRVIKRLIDLAIGVPALIFFLPVLILLCLAIMVISPGSPLFVQPREGQNGRRINMIKLRTMYRDADARLFRHLEENPQARQEWRRYFKLRKDPRILPILGNLLRKSSLDEVPQLWNVVCGDMSLIGPRPFPEYHLKEFGAGFRKLRSSVPPGLSGLWQVLMRSEGDIAAQEALDTYYIRNWSLWLDAYILVKTFRAVAMSSGAR